MLSWIKRLKKQTVVKIRRCSCNKKSRTNKCKKIKKQKNEGEAKTKVDEVY